jgi:hypothetical protein
MENKDYEKKISYFLGCNNLHYSNTWYNNYLIFIKNNIRNLSAPQAKLLKFTLSFYHKQLLALKSK